MAKVNEFETAEYKYSGEMKRFDDQANMEYLQKDVDSLTKDNGKLLSTIIQHHREHQVKRLKILKEYYDGNNVKILRGKRRREEHLADNRAIHPFGEYVATFIQGYLVGVPLKTAYTDDDMVEEQLRDINRTNDADEHNSDLILDLSIYGRAYELVYRNKDDEVRFTKLEPTDTFIIYENTVDKAPLAAVRIVNEQFTDESKAYLYTDTNIIEYDIDDSNSAREVDKKQHHFKGVPIIEYKNNKDRMGDYERVLNLIDAYDEAESDTANYMTDLNDAMLVIKGNLMIDEKQARNQKKYNLLLLQAEAGVDGKEGNVDADYIYKKYDVGGTEAYKTRIANDIHMFTHTPNMNDENFGGVQSGEAMKYKLFGLEQKRATKERLFKKSIRDRYRLVSNILETAAEGSFEVNNINITFTPNLPKSLIDEINAFTKLGGELSEETKLTILSFIENPSEELEKIEQEADKNKARIETRPLQDFNFPKQDGVDNGDA